MAHSKKYSETKTHIVDVARKLFAQYGKNAVTMNDIATQSGKGRRTLYTYFRNKDEIYLAIIQTELELIIERLSEVTIMNINAKEKLELYIRTRFDAIKEVVTRNGSLKAVFFRSVYEVEKARRRIDIREIRMLRTIFHEGLDQGVFELYDPDWQAIIFLYGLRGLEPAYMNTNIGSKLQENFSKAMDAIFHGICKNCDTPHLEG